MINLLARALMMSTPLLYGSLSEVFAERTGMMVTAIEGIFLMGAWAGFVCAFLTKSLFLGLLAAMAAGILVSAVYGWITVTLKQHQIVTGTAINILVLGLCSFLQRVIFGVPLTPLTVQPLQIIKLPLLSKIPVLGPVFFSQNILTYLMYLIVPFSFFVLYRTSLGLTLRSAGENPEAVDVAGINVNRVRFLAVLFSGAMGGIAGSFYSIGYLGMFTTSIIGGRGWIAFAICFLGNWNPIGAFVGTLVFGLAEAVAIYMQSSSGTFLPNELFIALPYILTIFLTVSRKSFNVPAKLGTPYNKEN
ncbi:putative ABC-type transport system, permease component [Sphaerochaeta pleomorpha str. Grapes]|uniref:Putative ABC-type transport system, permease component n=1 Tax=Sphaerochaeta pleomorpha (strain ATCC BAA-1885 / DSM 22778 / Grapes) TaxID=158190 RepID=G8QYJ6_SPHPG|nr:ABC transporter permease [Sphaerochaeta pleomorpha]AEV28559.1 putative ABC-type transport system, permease component [Sphaerochaeta pleomorpha str. Grapes]